MSSFEGTPSLTYKKTTINTIAVIAVGGLNAAIKNWLAAKLLPSFVLVMTKSLQNQR